MCSLQGSTLALHLFIWGNCITCQSCTVDLTSIIVFLGGGDPAQLLNTWHHETMLLVEPSKLPALALMPIGSIAEGLELPVQLAYLLLLVAIVGSGAFVVIRQALIRRELDESAKKLGEAIRGGEATSEVMTWMYLMFILQHAWGD